MSHVLSSLREIDLNLLVSLKVLLSYRHVSRAAEALDLTQSGMSRNLARLRSLLGDDLLVRVGNHMVLTPRAEQLQLELDTLLSDIAHLFQGRQFNPRDTEMHFRFAAADFVTQLFFPVLCTSLFNDAPGLRIDATAWSGQTLHDLEQGKLDFAFGGVDSAPAGIYRAVLGRSTYVCATSSQNPVKITLDTYCSQGHVVPTLEGFGKNPIDSALAELGRQRNVVIRTPHFMSGLATVAQTHLVMVVPQALALAASMHYSLSLHPLPFTVEMPPFCLLWHQRHHRSPAHQWFRQWLMQRIGAIFGMSPPDPVQPH